MKFETTHRTIEFSIETSETYTFRRSSVIANKWCPGCGREMAMAAPEIVAAKTGLSVRKVYSIIETGQFHFLESPAGLLICLESIKREMLTVIDEEQKK